MYLKIVYIDSFYYLKIKLLDLRDCMQKGRKTTYKTKKILDHVLGGRGFLTAFNQNRYTR